MSRCKNWTTFLPYAATENGANMARLPSLYLLEIGPTISVAAAPVSPSGYSNFSGLACRTTIENHSPGRNNFFPVDQVASQKRMGGIEKAEEKNRQITGGIFVYASFDKKAISQM